tara:strand:- start:13305 stop:14069 length:765 start_codon:yes stop_codon:yes gene_type:complete
MTTLLFDGDLITYRSAISCEVPTKWDDDIWTLHADAKIGIEKLKDEIFYFKNKLNADRIIIALSSKTNFRKELTPTYKSNRKKIRKPIIYKHLLDWLQKTYECFQHEGLEGDDVMGILATSGEIQGNVVLVSSDKDMRTIPANHIGLDVDDVVEKVSKKEADYWFMMQTLTGDSTDGYSGCPKIGKVTAQRILTDVKHDINLMWEKVIETYKKAKLTEEDALLQSRLARILRVDDWDKQNKKPILWSPTNAQKM